MLYKSIALPTELRRRGPGGFYRGGWGVQPLGKSLVGPLDQIPLGNPNVQIPNPNEIPNPNVQIPMSVSTVSSLEIGHWDFIGHWDLDIGHSLNDLQELE